MGMIPACRHHHLNSGWKVPLITFRTLLSPCLLGWSLPSLRHSHKYLSLRRSQKTSVLPPQQDLFIPRFQQESTALPAQPEVSVPLPQLETSVLQPQQRLLSAPLPQRELSIPLHQHESSVPSTQPEVSVLPPQQVFSASATARVICPSTAARNFCSFAAAKDISSYATAGVFCPPTEVSLLVRQVQSPLPSPPEFLHSLVPPPAEFADTTRPQCSHSPQNTDLPTPMKIDKGPIPETVVITSCALLPPHVSNSTSATRTMRTVIESPEICFTEIPHSPFESFIFSFYALILFFNATVFTRKPWICINKEATSTFWQDQAQVSFSSGGYSSTEVQKQVWLLTSWPPYYFC